MVVGCLGQESKCLAQTQAEGPKGPGGSVLSTLTCAACAVPCRACRQLSNNAAALNHASTHPASTHPARGAERARREHAKPTDVCCLCCAALHCACRQADDSPRRDRPQPRTHPVRLVSRDRGPNGPGGSVPVLLMHAVCAVLCCAVLHLQASR
jgi:hypothetical protein